MRSSLSSFAFLLTLGAAVFCTMAEGEADSGDCCSKRTFCCGSSCLPNRLQALVRCPSDGCCDPDSEPPVDDPEPCICTLEYEPLCNPKTGVTFNNICLAVRCGGLDEADLVEGECKDEDDEEDECCPEDQACCGSRCIPSDELAFTICPAEQTCCDEDGGGEDPGCFCPLFVDPVCSESTGEQFSNACFAGCSDDPGPFSAEACG